ncbi:MAG: heparinase II/III family protein, partial [Notoacmeibacter sp.]
MPRSISPAQEGLMIARLAVGKAGTAFGRFLRSIPQMATKAGSRTPSRVDYVLPDIRTADPYIAEQIYSGLFPLAGRILSTEGHSPFTLKMPSLRFARTLHSFSWLRHLHASGTELASANARSLVTQWLDHQAKLDKSLVWADDVVSKRLMALLQHSSLVLQGADLHFNKRFLKSLALHVRHLRASIPGISLSETRLRARIAIAYSRVALPTGEAGIIRDLNRLIHDLERDIFADGGHVSRNPEILLELLADLVPLRMS